MNSLQRLLSRGPLAVCLTLLLAACGGGGGDIAGVGTGGTGTITSTVSVGEISGFGSVIVTGVRFDDSTATVTDEDGVSRTRDDLKLGMVTAISGSADFTAGTGIATEIRYGSEVLGPVSAVDVAASRLTVLGVAINVKSTTVFADGLAGLTALRAGDRVEIYGFYNAASSAFTATRIEPRPTATRFKLRGPVSALDTASQRFTVAGLRIDYAAVPVADRPALANGTIVRVSATTVPSGGLWQVDALGNAPRAVLADGEAKIQGDISAMLSASRFVVDGVTIDASAVTVSSTLAVGTRVEAEGTVSSGVLFAKEIELENEDESSDEAFEITALIDSFNPLTLQFRLREQLVDASRPGVIYENGTAADLANGRRIEMKGYFDAASGAVIARLIHFED